MHREGREMGECTRELTLRRLNSTAFGFKTRGAEFCEFVKPKGLGPWNVRGQLTQHSKSEGQVIAGSLS